ncbi:MAG: lipoate--protein ligase [Bacilli bacterium]|jgi:lipoyltransferase/lipoate-protein ligase|nr:lipoate--protein ligase [Acholeplasmataceae bacterium]
MKVIDLRKYGQNEISFYLALEELIVENFEEDVFFLWDIASSIVIGRHQLINSEVNLAFTKKHNIKIYRRPSGGGAIFADEGCFMYTFVVSEHNYDSIYQKTLPLLMNVLRKLGLDVTFSGRNDLMFNNKKFSGTAILQTPNASVMHGTFLYDTDIAKLVEALTVDQSKILSKGIKSVSERVINLKPYLSLTKNQLMDYILENIGGELIELTDEQYQKTKVLEQKYLSDEWIQGKNPKFTFQNKKYFPFGNFGVYLLIKNNKINEVVFKGDFFEKKPLEDFYQHLIDREFDYDEIKKILEQYPLSDYIEKASNEHLLELLFEEVKE